jgi:hypothetical protein
MEQTESFDFNKPKIPPLTPFLCVEALLFPPFKTAALSFAVQ